MDLTLWSQLDAHQQYAHITRYGPPPAGWPVRPLPRATVPQPTYQPAPAPAPVVNVVSSAQAVNVQRGGGCAAVIGMVFLIFLVTKYWWVLAIAALIAVTVWAVRRAHT